MISNALTSLRVVLQGCHGVKPEQKAMAEARFLKVLTRNFQSEEEMSRALKLFNDASEGVLISKTDEKSARSWQHAYDSARQVGLQDINVEEAFFDVRLC